MKRKLSAKDVLNTIHSGLSYEELLERYGISEVQLDKVRDKLIAAKLITMEVFPTKDTVKQGPTNAPRSLWQCPPALSALLQKSDTPQAPVPHETSTDTDPTKNSRQAPKGLGNHMENKKIDHKEFQADVAAGRTPSALKMKYGLSDSQLKKAFDMLVVESGIEIIADENKTKQVKPVWKCPACGLPQPRLHTECPECGIIAAKYKKKTPHRLDQQPPPVPNNTQESTPIKQEAQGLTFHLGFVVGILVVFVGSLFVFMGLFLDEPMTPGLWFVIAVPLIFGCILCIAFYNVKPKPRPQPKSQLAGMFGEPIADWIQNRKSRQAGTNKLGYRTWGVIIVVILIGASILGNFLGPGKHVTRNDFGDEWPFTVDSGYVYYIKKGPNLKAPIFETEDGTRYALTGLTKMQFGYPFPDSIWKTNPLLGAPWKINIGPITELALKTKK